MHKKHISALSIFILTTSVVFLSCDKKVGRVPEKKVVVVTPSTCDSSTFSQKISSIISNSCATSGCHDSGSGNGDFTSYPGIKVKVDNASLKTRVFDSPDNPMPPTGNGVLSSQQLAYIKCWLENGAKNN